MILKKVINFKFVGASRYTGYADKSIRLYLECGHDFSRKASHGVPKRARCRDCERGTCKVPRMVPSLST